MAKIRAAALVSDNGAKLQALIDSVYFNEIPDFELVIISTRADSYALTRAQNAGLEGSLVEANLFPNGASLSLALLNKLRDLDIDLIITAGFEHSLGDGISRLYEGKVIGVRPTLVPMFDDMGSEGIFEAVMTRGLKLTGATAYYADSKGGVGAIIMQRSIEVSEEDTAESLRRRVMEELEWRMLLESVKLHCAGKLRLEDGRVYRNEAN